jgi:hypothetical protein
MYEITIREYQQGDEYGIVQLFKSIFGREMTIDEWNWKYIGQGNEKVCSAVMVNEHNHVVGHYGGIPFRMIHYGREMTGIATCDVMIMSQYRGIGRLKKLHDFFVDSHVRNGVTMFYGFPTEKTLLLPLEKKGLYERVEPVLEATKNLDAHKDRINLLYRLVHLSFDDQRIDDIWVSVRENFELAVIRDRDYFDWRYKRNPLFSYEILGLTKRWSNKLLGLVVFKRDDSDTLLVMDIVFYERIFNSLLIKTEGFARNLGKKRMGIWLPQRMHHTLETLGFISRPSGATLPHSTHPATLKKDEIRAHFFYTCGDTDFL